MSGARIRPRRLVLVGSVLVDVLMYIERLPEKGGDTLAYKTSLTTGAGFNTLLGAQRLGLAAVYAGHVGDGPMGNQISADLFAAGIPLLLPRIQGEDSGFDVALVERDAERTFITSPGVESRLRLEDLRSIPVCDGDAIYISGYELCYPVSGAALEQWVQELGSHILLTFDPGPLVTEIPAQRLATILARTDILSLNAREARLLAGEHNLEHLVLEIVPRLAPAGRVVARDGERGCWIGGVGRAVQHIVPRPTQPVDTTGAGDAHVAALLARLAAGDDFSTAARIANVAASLSIERPGPATSPTVQELQAALSEV
ncbi:ribokinase [Ktedonobacteria bacterium brp13]|nr:ribokinase [Ktedonobacteria bacterium brp13]